MKTIKKHSKDPLKEFANISKDIDWEKDDEETVATKIIKTVTTTDPIVKTTVTRITSEGIPEGSKSKIPVLANEAGILRDETRIEEFDAQDTPKSKIPVLKTESMIISSPDTIYTEKIIQSPNTTRVVETTTTTIVSPISRTSTTVDSDSEDDSRRESPPLKSILKKTTQHQPQHHPGNPVGSSSGSDIALHEEGAELSSDSGMYYRMVDVVY